MWHMNTHIILFITRNIHIIHRHIDSAYSLVRVQYYRNECVYYHNAFSPSPHTHANLLLLLPHLFLVLFLFLFIPSIVSVSVSVFVSVYYNHSFVYYKKSEQFHYQRKTVSAPNVTAYSLSKKWNRMDCMVW